MINVIGLFLDIYSWVIIIRVFLSLMGMTRYENRFARFVYDTTDPIIRPLQRIIPIAQVGNYYLDFSPLIVLFVINLIERYLIKPF